MKIAVLMSGGVDSSFAAFYLKKQGFDIFGITFLQLGEKLQKEELKRVKNVAKEISIPHFVVKKKSVFEKEIIREFCESFKRGETPNPCPLCNKKIKFGVVLKEAEKLGSGKIATGHYVRLKKENLSYNLYRAKDKSKDQSYFLWQLSQSQLKKVIFPLGDFTKKEVLKEINESPLSKFFKKKGIEDRHVESQDVCFLESQRIDKFLKKKLGEKKGLILDRDKNKMGEHPGIHFFTIGQRSGLKIGAKKPRQKPFYVTEIDKKKNSIIVGHEDDLYKKELVAQKINWISKKAPKLISAKIRYQHKPASATISCFKNKTCHIKFKTPQRAITPGQHIVFHKKDLLLGGGVIKEILD
jgi:tRNA-specific 2-thiouridylase